LLVALRERPSRIVLHQTKIDQKSEIPGSPDISGPLCRCGRKLSLLNGQQICVPCLEGERASEETALNFARASILTK
jgi:hypothetical protein